MKYVPMMVGWSLAGKRALVVGAGQIATARVRALLAAGAHVRVVAPRVSDELERWSERGKLELERRPAELVDVNTCDLLIVAIDDPEVSRSLADAARERRIPVHVADRTELCDFVFPAVHREGPLQVAVSTAGCAPALAGRLRDHLRAALPVGAARSLVRFDKLRKRVRLLDGDRPPGRRMGWLRDLARRLPWAEMASWKHEDIQSQVADFLDSASQPGHAPSPTPAAQRGRVQLVGSGPGAVDQLTLGAERALREADLVLADRLIPPAILALVEGELRVAPKQVGGARRGQSLLTRWMLEGVRAGRHVVRLKIGDPSLFGRSGEELAALHEAGFDAEVLPGISSLNAAAAAAGIPLTLRGTADRVWVGTARGEDGREVELPHYEAGTTYAFLMGVRVLESLGERLTARGFPSGLPATLVCHASQAAELRIQGSLADIAQRARERGVDPPGVLFLGYVCRDLDVQANASPHVSELALRGAS